MKLNELSPAAGSTKEPKRKGRGTGSGNGTTAGRGMKGQWARSGGGVRPGFAGGQMPIYMQLPKRGFNNMKFAKKYAVINVCDLANFDDGATVDVNALIEKNIIKKEFDGVKVLANGEITKKINLVCTKISEAAKAKIEAAGGKVEVK